MLNRRTFFKSSAGAAVAFPQGATIPIAKGSPFLIGRWMVRSDSLHFADEKTAFIRSMNHESPQIKFPRGVPDRGDPVRVNITWDVCYDRGALKHRSLGKMVLRVVPIGPLDRDAEIHFVETPPFRLDADEFRPLFPTSLHATNRPETHTIYAVKVTAETAELFSAANSGPYFEVETAGDQE